jgi:acetyl esterase/lipase
VRSSEERLPFSPTGPLATTPARGLTDGHPSPGGPPPEGFQIPEADVSHVSRKWLDIAYADLSPAQKLDLYLPEEGKGPFPVILHIHGGAFAIGDKRDVHVDTWLRGLERGYAVASVNYRLSGEAVFPAGLQDVKAAVRWLRAYAEEYRLDTARIAACGGSSGANFAAMMGVTSGAELFNDPQLGNAEQSAEVQAVIDWFGPTDFLKMDEQLAANGLGPADHSQPDSPESRYLGAPITDVPDLVGQADPKTYVHKGMAPILIQHGTADCLVPYQQSVEFARVIEERAGPTRCELDVFEGAGHDDPLFDSPQNMERVFAFIDRHLGRPRLR